MAKSDVAKPPASPTDRPAAGESVNLVTAYGEHVLAEVTGSRAGGRVDLRAVYRDEEVVVTNSPYDPIGTTPDSWHRPGTVTPVPAVA